MNSKKMETVLANLSVGDFIQSGCNGRWSEPAKIIRLGEVFASGFGGIARTVEWAFGDNATISSCLGSRDMGRFWRRVAP